VTSPLLRKDFILDEYQLFEAVACGADAVLLIVSALADEELYALHATAERLGLAVLVEVHDEDEVARALTAGARIIGVNNRNLRTLEVDTRASELAAQRIPSAAIAVSESGLKTRDDVARMRAMGYRAFLVGEQLVTASDPGVALAELRR
jgi:indole-3-glycerol phosphate synthase